MGRKAKTENPPAPAPDIEPVIPPNATEVVSTVEPPVDKEPGKYTKIQPGEKTFFQILKEPLSESDRLDILDDIDDLSRQRDEIEIRLKQISTALKGEIAEKEEKIANLIALKRQGEREHNVEVCKRIDYENGTVTVFRVDNGLILEKRGLSPDESQTKLNLDSTLTPGASFDDITNAILELQGVVEVAIFHNPTDSTDDEGIPPHHIRVVVDGGEAAEICRAIVETRPGILTNGNHQEVIDDHMVYFSRPVAGFNCNGSPINEDVFSD